MTRLFPLHPPLADSGNDKDPAVERPTIDPHSILRQLRRSALDVRTRHVIPDSWALARQTDRAIHEKSHPYRRQKPANLLLNYT